MKKLGEWTDVLLKVKFKMQTGSTNGANENLVTTEILLALMKFYFALMKFWSFWKVTLIVKAARKMKMGLFVGPENVQNYKYMTYISWCQ